MERLMSTDGELDWTGERLIAGVQGDVALEHLHRYALALELAAERAVLDIASGEGYGSSLLARAARRVIGVDIDPRAVDHASRHYARENLCFRVGSATDIPVESSSIDLAVSFETLEHLADHDGMLAELKRVLVPGGVLVVSTPDRRTYSELPGYHNPFHVKELDLAEFAGLVGRHFRSSEFLGERVCHGSLLAPIAGSGEGAGRFISLAGDYQAIEAELGLRAPVYLIAVASDGPLPRLRVPSLFEGREILSTPDLLLEDRDRRLAQVYDELERSRAALDVMANSASVRMTAPLRALGRWTRVLGGRGRRVLASFAHRPKGPASRSSAASRAGSS